MSEVEVVDQEEVWLIIAVALLLTVVDVEVEVVLLIVSRLMVLLIRVAAEEVRTTLDQIPYQAAVVRVSSF
jgi:hypothetical protein